MKQRITTSITFDMATWTVLDHQYYDYEGTVALCKGEGVAQDQLKQQNDLVKGQLAQQKAVQDQMQQAFGKYLSGNQGFDPAMLSALTSQFLNQNTGTFNSAGANVRSALSARGAGNGDLPVGGDYTRGIAELEGAKANSQSSGMLNLGVQNLQQALSNQFNSGSLINGQAAQLGQNIGVFNGGANSALGSYIQGANAPGFLSSLSTGLGSGLAGFATGGPSLRH